MIKQLTILFTLVSISCFAQKGAKVLTPQQQAKDNFEVYEIKNPFKKTKKIALAGVNLQFRLASNQLAGTERNSNASSSVWVTLNPAPSDELLQELTDAYGKMLKSKLTDAGFEVIDEKSLYQSDDYKKLIVEEDRLYVNKAWGISAKASYNEAPILEYPNFAGGAHAKLANRQDVLVWNSNTLIDFVWIDQEKKSKKDAVDITASVKPAIIINDGSAGSSGAGVGAQMKLASSTKIMMQGPDFSTYNIALKPGKYVASDKTFHTTVEKCSDCIPNFAERTTGGKVLRESLTVLSMGRAGDKSNTDIKFSFEVKSNEALYKEAVLDALNEYADQIILLMTTK